MPKYKIKEGQTVNFKKGSLKTGDFEIETHKGGESVEMSEKDAMAHADVLENAPVLPAPKSAPPESPNQQPDKEAKGKK